MMLQHWIGRAFRRPHAVATILSVSIGIAASTAVFSLLNVLLFKPTGVDDAADIVQITMRDTHQQEIGVSRLVADGLARSTGLAGTCSFLTPLAMARIDGLTTTASSLALAQDCLPTLGVRVTMGRLFVPSDFASGATAVAVVTDDGWKRLFGGRHDIVGRRLFVDDRTVTVVGVTEPRFRGLLIGFPALLLLPLPPTDPTSALLPTNTVNVLARVARGRSVASTAAQLRAEWPQLSRGADSQVSGDRTVTSAVPQVVVRPAAAGIDFALRPRFSKPLWALLGLSAGVLMMACLNLTHLLVARRLTRHREIAVRLALGASPMRLLRGELAADSLLVGCGAVVGMLLAYGANLLTISWLRDTFRGLEVELAPDARVYAFVVGVASLVTGIAAVSSFWYLKCIPDRSVLAAHADASAGSAATRVRRLLAIAQIAAACALVAVAMGLSGTLSSVRAMDVGFVPDEVLSAQLMVPGAASLTASDAAQSYRSLLDRIADHSHISSAALASSMPFSVRPPRTAVALPDNGEPMSADLLMVTDDFFSVLGAPLLEGRSLQFTSPAADIEAVISASLGRRIFGDRSPLGRSLDVTVDGFPRRANIVGVSRDLVLGDPRTGDTSVVYLAFSQFADRVYAPALLLRAPRESYAVMRGVEMDLRQRGREIPTRTTTLRVEHDRALLQERLSAAAAGGFAGVSYLLAAVGLYGVLAALVADRRQEIGIRLAVGAAPRDVALLVARRAMILVGLGTAVGLPLAWAAYATVQAWVPYTRALAPEMLALLAMLTQAVAGVTALPAWRAARVSPSTALRAD